MDDVLFISREPAGPLRGLIARITGYCSPTVPSAFLETAELVFPLVFNLGQPWRIALGAGRVDEPARGFTAGLFPGPVAVTSPAGAELVQVDLTPLGAVHLFGGGAAELASQVVDLDAVAPFANTSEELHDRLHAAASWDERFDIVERFLAPRFDRVACPQVRAAWQFLASGMPVAEVARLIGWSSRHLSGRFRRETGLRPVTAARMLRFQRARALALRGGAPGWADIAAAAGYADQSHLIRDFRDFAGEPPTAWAGRTAPPEPRLAL